jgi:hypothetical protein
VSEEDGFDNDTNEEEGSSPGRGDRYSMNYRRRDTQLQDEAVSPIKRFSD